MSRKTVRAAIKAWFEPPAVPLLNAVYRSEPKTIDGREFFGGEGAASGAVAFVYIEREHETRIALGGEHSGKKLIHYDVGLVITFRSDQPKAEDAMDDYDDLVEGLKERLRADRTLGTVGATTPIFQAGETDDDIEIVSDLPRLVGEQLEVLTALRFGTEEIINS